MTKTNMDLSELLAKHDQGDFLRSIAEAVLQLIMEADVEGLIGSALQSAAVLFGDVAMTKWISAPETPHRSVDHGPTDRLGPVPAPQEHGRAASVLVT